MKKYVICISIGIISCFQSLANSSKENALSYQIQSLDQTLRYIVENNILDLGKSESVKLKSISNEGSMWRIELIKDEKCLALVGGPELNTVMFQSTIFECKN